MKRIFLSVSIPLIIFSFFILWISLMFSGGWAGFFSGNIQCDVSFGPEDLSNQHSCGYIEFFSDTLYLAYVFLISGWWAIVIGVMVLIYGGSRFIKKYWWISILIAIAFILYFLQAYI
ncbi:MAG: hypothetical protein Q7R89_02070 [bacterium]|nr:hypothetical protein [bacterium]